MQYPLLHRCRNPVRGDHLPSCDDYSALIFIRDKAQFEHHKEGASDYTRSCTAYIIKPQIDDVQGHTQTHPLLRNWHNPIKYYSSVSGGLRETKASIWVQGSICYHGYGSVKSTVLFLNFSHIIQLDICVRALERITIKKSRLFCSSDCFHGPCNFSNRCS